ncbi:MAG: DUF4912 domain-containing protein [Candidatus Omnitrophica bacterium]|nr:DUF4912 domain-containing protein [Candidatus Omnitrophota bacterium]
MSKERLIDALARKSAKKTRAKKTPKAAAKVQRVITQINTLPQYRRLREKAIKTPTLVVEGQQKVEESKYYLGPAPSYKGAEEFRFPEGYGDNKIVIMVRDPWWLYSYWEITRHREDEVRQEIRRNGLAPVKSILRVYDVTDIEFNGGNAHSHFDIELTGLASNWYINIGTPNKSWIVEIGILASGSRFFLLARSNCVRTPRFGMSEVIDEEWMCAEEDYWRMFGLSGGFGIGKASLALREMFKKRLLEQITSGGVSSISSPVKRAAKKKGFWLVVDAELIVYGQTEPDAKVTVQNKRISLRKDGTFTLRFALPDGKQEIPVVATSFDGDDTKTITPIVTRKTV